MLSMALYIYLCRAGLCRFVFGEQATVARLSGQVEIVLHVEEGGSYATTPKLERYGNQHR